MKKLIAIAAVVAAGSVFGQWYVYDFNATLKTTKAKSGSVTVNLGKDASGAFWYNDPAVTNYTKNADTNISSTKNINGIDVPTINPSFLATNLEAQIVVLAISEDYKYKSAGKYCETYKISGCYRVAGSKKLSTQFETWDCCWDWGTDFFGLHGVTTASKIQWTETQTNTVATTGAFGGPLLQRFGSSDYTKAKKVELYGPVEIWGAADQAFGGWLAGQGTIATKNNNDYINTISGNIVGVLLAPTCENCCTDGTPSIAFDCLGDDIFLPYTAGYGTFRLKINNKETEF